MEGCSAPLVVKFADTQKEKDQKRLQQMHANLWNLAGVGGGGLLVPAASPTPPHHAATNPFLPAPPQHAEAPISPATASLQLLQQLQAVGLHQQLLQGIALYNSHPQQCKCDTKTRAFTLTFIIKLLRTGALTSSNFHFKRFPIHNLFSYYLFSSDSCQQRNKCPIHF